MRDRPIPDRPERYALGYEVDAALARNRDMMISRSRHGIEIFIHASGQQSIRVRTQPVVGYDECFVLREIDGLVQPYDKTVHLIRRKIAVYMGLELAAFCSFLPNHYDARFKQEFQYSIRTKCRFDHKYCVRPSHLVPCLHTGHNLRPLGLYVPPKVTDLDDMLKEFI